MLPGEIVTTFKPAPGAFADDGATSVCLSDIGDGGGGDSCVPASGMLAGPLPEIAPLVFAGQSPLEPMLRTGRGGTLGMGLF
jgi:hypothetical protein